jgi:5-oxoprolinase (ATP-hydrolysing)
VCTYNFEDLRPGHKIDGPAILFQSISTIVLEIGCTALVTADGDLDITVVRKKYEDKITSTAARDIQVDQVLLSIYGHRFMGIAEQMGRTLARTAISVNIKERLDFSVRLLFLLTLFD